MSVDGDWIITAHTPKGDYEWKLSLAAAGDEVTGTLDIGDSVVPIEDGRLDGDRLTWKGRLERPRFVRFTGQATITGDRIHGQVSMGLFGTRSFGGARAPRS
jgi:hypothetical protein